MMAIRKILPVEYTDYAEHLKRLGPEEQACRFMGAVRDEAIDGHVQDIQRPGNLVLGWFVDGRMRGAAELVRTSPAVPSLQPGEAELAVTVEKDFQRAGAGTELVRRMLLAARNRGIETVHTVCLVDNLRMRRIVGHFDGTESCHYGMCEGDIALTIPTQVSIMEEAVDEGAAVLEDMFNRLGWRGPRADVLAEVESGGNPSAVDAVAGGSAGSNVTPFPKAKIRA